MKVKMGRIMSSNKPYRLNLTHGEMIFHSCLGTAYERIVNVCGLSDAQAGDFVYLTFDQVEKLKALSTEVPLLGTTFLETISKTSSNAISGGIIATFVNDENHTPWVMLHVHRFGNAEADTNYGVRKNDEVIKEDILALSASVDATQDSTVLQRMHANYTGRYTFDSAYQCGLGGIQRGVKQRYEDFTNNQLCCDVVTQPLNGINEMLSSIEQI